MFGFSRSELIESDLENKPSTYKSFPACMVMGCLMCILSIIMMVTTERVPSETVAKKLEYKKIEYIKLGSRVMFSEESLQEFIKNNTIVPE